MGTRQEQVKTSPKYRASSAQGPLIVIRSESKNSSNVDFVLMVYF